jgi:peptidoglycan/LPS O-acetylase OafA/YrhL
MRRMLVDKHPEESVRAGVGQIDGVEALRAVAVAWVVGFHYLVVRTAGDPWNAWISASTPANTIVRNGYLGVDLFFLITGFLLVLPWALRALEGRAAPRAADFYARRIRRIVPAYYVQLIVLFAVMVPLLLGAGYVRGEGRLIALNAAAHALFLHYTTPLTSASMTLNGALWTLTLEAQFYLLLPLLAPIFVRAPLACSLAMAGAAALWRWLAMNDLAPLVSAEMALGARWAVPEATIRHLLFTQLPGYLAHFAAGMALGVWWLRRRHLPVGNRAGIAWLAALAAAGALLYWAYALGGGAVLGRVGSWFATLAALCVLLAAMVRGGALTERLLVHKPVLFVGRTSYSTYLYHLPLMLAWNHFRIFDTSWLSLPLYLAALLLVAWASYELVERRFIEARPAAARPRPIIAG